MMMKWWITDMSYSTEHRRFILVRSLMVIWFFAVKRPVTKTTTKPTRAPRTTPSTQPTPTDPPTDPLTDAPTSTTIPSACKPRTKYDAVVMEKDRRGKSHTHFFHRELFWTLNERLQRGEPKRVSDYWPDVRTPIDAAYRNRKGNIVFFTGNQWVTITLKRFVPFSCPWLTHTNNVIEMI